MIFLYCGDSFVSSIERGSELYALYGFSGKNAQDLHSKTQNFKGSASYLGFSGSLSYDSTKLLEHIKSHDIESIQYYHSAHRGLMLPHDEKSIYSSLQYLGNAIKLEDSYPYKVHLTRYSDLPEVKKNLTFGATINESREAYRIRLEGLMSRLDHVLKAPNEYNLDHRGKKPSFYRRLQDAIKVEIDKVEAVIQNCQFTSYSAFIDNESVLKKLYGKR